MKKKMKTKESQQPTKPREEPKPAPKGMGRMPNKFPDIYSLGANLPNIFGG